MNCKNCDLYTKDEVLLRYDGLCTFCFGKANAHLFCLVCYTPIRAEDSQLMDNLCEKHYNNRESPIVSKEPLIKKVRIFACALNFLLLVFLALSLLIFMSKDTDRDAIWVAYFFLTLVHYRLAILLLSHLRTISGVHVKSNILMTLFIPGYFFTDSKRHIRLKPIFKNLKFLFFAATFIAIFLTNINVGNPSILNFAVCAAFAISNFSIALKWTVGMSYALS